MAETAEGFQSLSLEDEDDTAKLSASGDNARPPAEDQEVAAINVGPLDTDEGAQLQEDKAMERSMERTVNLPAADAGLASLSPVDERDLIVTISEPRVNPPANTYTSPFVTYCVTTRTTRQTFDKSEYSVRRRYQDFVWLRDQLADTYVTHIVPPLPEKHTLARLVQNDHFTPEFLKRRGAALQKFLTRCVEHPTMSFDRTLMAFMIANDKDFQSLRSKGVGLMDKVSASFRQVASGFLLKNPDPEFTKLQTYFAGLSKHLAEIEASAAGVLQDGGQEAIEYRTLSDLCQKWSEYEQADGEMLRVLSESFNSAASISEDMNSELSPAFAPFHEYALYCDSAQEVLKRRETLQMYHAFAIEDLMSKQAAVENAKTADMSKSVMSFFSDPKKLKEERVAQAEKAFATAQTAAERANDDLECANEHLRADMARWQRVKKSDMASTFVDVADVHIAHLQKSLSVWQTALQKLEQTGQSSEARAAKEDS